MNFRAKLASAVAATLLFAGAVDAREMRVGTAVPEGSTMGAAISEWIALVNERSGGDLVLKGYYRGALGDEQTMVRQAIRGRLDFAGVSTTAQTLIVPEYALVAEPFVFETAEERFCVEDNHMDSIFGERFAENGAVQLGFIDIGFETIFSQTPIKEPGDLAGVKMRTPPTRAQERFASLMGASVVTSGVGEIIPNLKTGAVNAATTVLFFGVAIGIPDLAPHMTGVGAIQTSASMVVSKQVWDSLTPEQQKLLADAADEVFPSSRQKLEEANKVLVAKALDKGATYYVPNEAEMEKWRAVSMQSREEGIEEFGAAGAEYWSQIQAAVAACRG